jgi:heme a synthase
MSPLSRSQAIYRKLAVASFVTVLILICIGATVRITGAGMGCPDWPTCYGKVIPPTDVSEIDASRYNTADFNPVLTWIEYINRLSGVTTGIIAFLAAVFSLSWRKRDKLIPFTAFAALFLVGYAGWLGAKVVESNLHAGTITVHMLVALGVLFLNILALARINKDKENIDEHTLLAKISWLTTFTLAVLLAQIIVGTLVRGEVESIAAALGAGERGAWLAQAKEYLPMHKITSLGVMIVTAYLLVKLYNIQDAGAGLKMARFTLLLSTLGQVVTGLVLDSFGFPALGQLFHLVFAVTMFSSITYVLCQSILGRAKAHAENKDIIYA